MGGGEWLTIGSFTRRTTGPLMLELGVAPPVAAASAACMILFTSASASAAYWTFGYVCGGCWRVGGGGGGMSFVGRYSGGMQSSHLFPYVYRIHIHIPNRLIPIDYGLALFIVGFICTAIVRAWGGHWRRWPGPTSRGSSADRRRTITIHPTGPGRGDAPDAQVQAAVLHHPQHRQRDPAVGVHDGV